MKKKRARNGKQNIDVDSEEKEDDMVDMKKNSGKEKTGCKWSRKSLMSSHVRTPLHNIVVNCRDFVLNFIGYLRLKMKPGPTFSQPPYCLLL